MKIIKSEDLSALEALEILEKRKERKEEQEICYEFLKKSLKIKDKETMEELKKELLSIKEFKEHQVNKLLEILPFTEEQVNAIFAKERINLSKNEIEKIVEKLREVRDDIE